MPRYGMLIRMTGLLVLILLSTLLSVAFSVGLALADGQCACCQRADLPVLSDVLAAPCSSNA